MKDMRSLVIGALAIALVCGVAWILEPKRPTTEPDPAGPAVVRHSVRSPRHRSARHKMEWRTEHTLVQSQPAAQESPMPVRGTPRPKPVEPQTEAGQTGPVAVQVEAVTPPTPTPPGTSAAEGTIRDPTAQDAPGPVDLDPNMEMAWEEAINDPNFWAQEAPMMMGDGNEDGLSDQEDPTTDDQP